MKEGLGMEAYQALIVDPSAGLSGDMFLGCLLELGTDRRKVVEAISSLPGMEPFELITEEVVTRGISMKRTRVSCDSKAASRDFRGIKKMILEADLEERVKDTSVAVFGVIAEAEGKIHGRDPGDVHFHEVGAVDSIVDIVGSAVSMGLLGWPKIYHRPFRLGSGMITMAHGEMPAPAPATLEILRESRVRMTDEEGEIVTPTGAAIMKVAAEELPSHLVFKPGKVVYSSGTRDYGKGPGFLRITAIKTPPLEKNVVIARTTLDDINPEILGYLRDGLFELGAYEVYLTSVIMKKGRPGVEVTVICPDEAKENVVNEIFLQTTTLGIRVTREERVELERRVETLKTEFGKVDVKFRELPDGSVDFSPEYESCRKAAEINHVPIERIYRAARAAAAKRVSD